MYSGLPIDPGSGGAASLPDQHTRGRFVLEHQHHLPRAQRLSDEVQHEVHGIGELAAEPDPSEDERNRAFLETAAASLSAR